MIIYNRLRRDIIYNCWTMSKQIIFTSNLSLNEIKKKYDKYGRIYSRILGESNKIFTINDVDKRVKQFKNRVKKQSALSKY